MPTDESKAVSRPQPKPWPQPQLRSQPQPRSRRWSPQAGTRARVRGLLAVLTCVAEGGMPRARRLALAEVAVGVPAAAWGVRRRSVRWAVVGTVLMVHGALELSYETVFPRD
ncbi:hypothetical protein [Streptomyces sp. NPDC002763]|uniref:hypothetical protein n=1 Tax=Streptomyces sp. NPDC002763 TaxID=3154427 RepID=UPI003326C334